MSYRAVRSIATFAALSVLLTFISRAVVAQSARSGKSISGTVVTVEDKPAQGVDVQIFSMKPKTVGPTVRGKDDGPTGDAAVGAPEANQLQRTQGPPLQTTKTDSTGKFTFKAIPAGPYTIVAGTGRNMAKVQIDVKDNEEVKPLSLKLPSK